MPQLQEEGKFPATVTGADFVEEPGTGKLILVVTFDTPSGWIPYRGYVTDKSAEYVLKNLTTMGYGAELQADPDNMDRVEEFIKGNRVEIVTENESFQGKDTLKVKWINSLGGIKGATKLTPMGKKKLHALFTGQPVPLTSAPRSSQAATALVDDTDIPF